MYGRTPAKTGGGAADHVPGVTARRSLAAQRAAEPRLRFNSYPIEFSKSHKLSGNLQDPNVNRTLSSSRNSQQKFSTPLRLTAILRKIAVLSNSKPT
jgi:hypothetical protein